MGLAVCQWPESASWDKVKLALEQDEICFTNFQVCIQLLLMWEIQHLMVENEMVWIFCTSTSVCFLTHTHLDQYQPQSSSIQGLVSLQGLNISWKQKEKYKDHEPWCFLNVSIWLDNGNALLPIKISSALYMFCFHRNSWENLIFLKLHRKLQQIASCLRSPLSTFHCVITSLSLKCGHSSSLFTYSVYQSVSHPGSYLHLVW